MPLELFGRDAYGARLGWASAARQLTSAFAPFALALMMARDNCDQCTVDLWQSRAPAVFSPSLRLRSSHSEGRIGDGPQEIGQVARGAQRNKQKTNWQANSITRAGASEWPNKNNYATSPSKHRRSTLGATLLSGRPILWLSDTKEQFRPYRTFLRRGPTAGADPSRRLLKPDECLHRGNKWTVYSFVEMPSGAADIWRLFEPCNPPPFDIEASVFLVNDRMKFIDKVDRQGRLKSLSFRQSVNSGIQFTGQPSRRRQRTLAICETLATSPKATA